MPYDVDTEIDQYGGLRPVGGMTMPLLHAQRFLMMAEHQRRMEEEAKAAAIRYQGQQEYSLMISQGAPPDEALRRSAAKMFYNHPGGETAALSDMRPPVKSMAAPPQMQNIGGRDFLVNTDRYGQQRAMNIPEPRAAAGQNLGILKSQLNSVNGRIKQAEGKLAGKTSLDMDEDQRAEAMAEIQSLYDDRDQIQNGIKEAGGLVAETGRPTIQQVPQVSTPRDRRGFLARVLPNALGGSSPPGPVTNMVARLAPPAAGAAPQQQTIVQAPDIMAKPAEAPAPLPEDKNDLEEGKLYMTRKGPARWDGKKFVQD